MTAGRGMALRIAGRGWGFWDILYTSAALSAAELMSQPIRVAYSRTNITVHTRAPLQRLAAEDFPTIAPNRLVTSQAIPSYIGYKQPP